MGFWGNFYEKDVPRKTSKTEVYHISGLLTIKHAGLNNHYPLELILSGDDQL